MQANTPQSLHLGPQVANTMPGLPLLIVCLLATQSVSAFRILSDPSQKQYVQVAMTFKGTTCADTPRGAYLLRDGARDSVKAYFTAKGYSSAIVGNTTGIIDRQCVDAQVSRSSSVGPAV